MILFAVFTVSSIILSVRDIRYFRVPRSLLVIFLSVLSVLRVGTALIGGFSASAFLPLAYGAAAFGLFYTVRFITKNKLGFADVLYAAGCALVLDFTSWLYAMLLACAGVLCFSVGKRIVFKVFSHVRPPAADPYVQTDPIFSKIPFIPFLAAGTLVMMTASLFLKN